jgi:hypothetical protein
MISTSLAYSILTKNMATSLNRVASQATTKRDIDYYNDNIGKVKTVDDLMGNYRLYNYAMTAYGLSDMVDSKAFMKKVLESDLNDTNSFANKLADSRYKTFAAAFNFGAATTDVQSDSQEDDLIGLYKQSYDNEATDAQTQTDYYNGKIDKIQNVDALLNDDQLRNYVLKANGFDPTYISKSYLKQVLTSDLSDPNSFANKTENDQFKAIAAEFSFNADGTPVNATVQTADQKAALTDLYNKTVPTFTTYSVAQSDNAYYQAHMGSITSVDEIVNDPRLANYIVSAFDLPALTSPFEVGLLLKSDLTNSSSYANVLGRSDVTKMFNFQTDGTLPAGKSAQDADKLKTTTTTFMSAYDDAQEEAINNAVKNYEDRTKSGIATIDDFFKSNASADNDPANDALPELYQVALRAYGIGNDEVTKSQLKKILTSDPYDSKSYVNSLKDDRFVELAKVFNFDSKGKVAAPLQALSPNVVSAYSSEYGSLKTLGLDGVAKTAASTSAKTDIQYFKDNIGGVTSVSDFLADKKLVSFVLTANSIDPKKVNTDTLKKAFSLGIDDPKNVLNDPKTVDSATSAKLKDIISSFNFDSKGNLTRANIGVVQDSGKLRQMNAFYLQETLESEQGQTDDGVRLALYFDRKAPGVSSIFDLMGDKALFQVITTTFSLPTSISSMDVDQQATMLKKFINVQDLQDPAKVDKLLKRFTAMYDLQNASSSSSALTILTGGSS